jgi:hypothetical protein
MKKIIVSMLLLFSTCTWAQNNAGWLNIVPTDSKYGQWSLNELLVASQNNSAPVYFQTWVKIDNKYFYVKIYCQANTVYVQNKDGLTWQQTDTINPGHIWWQFRTFGCR